MIESISISQEIFSFLVVIFSIIVHEVAHGYAAYIQGDHTAERAGRLTLSPLPHIDVLGSVIVPLVAFFTSGTFFGWAKPVPYNPHNIRTRIGLAFVAAAGVLTNLSIALVSVLAIKFLGIEGLLNEAVGSALVIIMTANLSLAFFNLIPVPPFDGMSILQALFPKLYIRQDIVTNPVYMVIAIMLASVLYDRFMPSVLGFISQLIF